MMFAVVVWGVVAWRRMQKKVELLTDALPPEIRVQVEQ
jgi:hypothetical protein